MPTANGRPMPRAILPRSSEAGSPSRSGMRFQASAGVPMSTENDRSPTFRHSISPASVVNSSVVLVVSRDRTQATHRLPLPHAPDCEPSVL